MKVVCVVPSAGRGKRLGSNQHKPFVKLGKKPILAHTLKVLNDSRYIDTVIVAVSRGRLKACGRLIRKYGFKKVRAVIAGGKSRFDSVRNGIREAPEADFILIHDGARPLVNGDLVRRVLLAAKKSGAAISATPLKQTLKRAGKNLFVSKTPERKLLWEAQTPQVFEKKMITDAYRVPASRGATDDASLVEKLGHKVKIVKGSSRNIKITTPEDLALAEILMKRRG